VSPIIENKLVYKFKITVQNSRGSLRTVKTYTVILVYRRKLVTLNVYLAYTVINCVSSVYVFHLIKFVSFCYRILLVNKDIHLYNRTCCRPTSKISK